ncbi:serine hydrolase domain-containing protein [Desulfotalea psychrophila]|uniref:Beta-lactamase-related domain-containing protein n=1 Tax=Desulfotalea psychrophila (strain LSv54 / DSM 12343) TaxID=177439 RepID=Q6AQJ7_DESPS|nr:serine hydrolase domain-containing protein [Desulfotalea psychrophila]CAG35376.1 hypothetical protein DP0647 [Desulfotalea psychrophila LSv54]
MNKKVKDLLVEGVKEGLFSGASVAAFHGMKGQSFLVNCGNTGDNNTFLVSEDTFYDLASLTKPLVTALSIACLVERGLLTLGTRLSEIYGNLSGKKGDISIGHLLSHASGLPAHVKFYESCKEDCWQYVIENILYVEPLAEVGESIYSDLGYMLLADIIEKKVGKRLCDFWFEEIAIPLGLEEDFCFSGNKHLGPENCALTSNIVDNFVYYCGQVHDDNCRSMGSYAGHAGLFGTVKGLLKLCKSIVNSYFSKGTLSFCSRDVLLLFLQRQQGSHWTYGFDTPSGLYSTSGRYFSQHTVGHLGFTGTSFWCDLEENIIIILLTNRALFNNNLRKMKVFRPVLHDHIMEYWGYDESSS